MALYNIASPSGGEKRMARFITDELRRMGILTGKTGTATSTRSKATGEATPVSWHTWTRYTAARPARMQPTLSRNQ